MQFILTAGWEDGIADLTQRLTKQLSAGQSVLWLVSGGSNVGAATLVMATIPRELTKHLSILLVDERYGPVGHAESNWQKLLQAGFDPHEATVLTVLQEGLDFTDTTLRYKQLAEAAFENNDCVIAQLGIGDDGHTAGIMVGTPDNQTAELVSNETTATFQRMSLTYAALRRINTAYAFAFGENKRQALQQLQTDLPFETQPSQVLKDVAEAYIYNDQIGEHA
jgi:6-phosphogluconolactonase/glucosamine-6-phosphate isomerase/deaminase